MIYIDDKIKNCSRTVDNYIFLRIMIKLFGKIDVVFFFFFSFIYSTFSHNISIEENLLKKFQEKQGVEERFTFFFSTANRYGENSAYDWLNTINMYLKETKKSKDSTNLKPLEIIQSQIYFDLGKYVKSIDVANRLYREKDNLNFKVKTILLDLMDQNYGQLQFYDKQIEIRKEKKELGITNNIVFHDIYSRLGHHRKAMTHYIMEMKKNIDENDLYSLAEYHNNIGNYLRLDESIPLALKKYKKARGYLDVYLNDIKYKKTEKQLIQTHHLFGIIKGNIGRCYVQMRKFKEAIPYLEKGIYAIKQYNKEKFYSDLIEFTLDLADCYLQLENYELLKKYLYYDLEYVVKLKHKIKRNKLLANYYNKIGDYKNTTFYLRNNARIHDSIGVNESVIKLQQLTALVEQDLANTIKKMDIQKEKMLKTETEMKAKDKKISLVFISLIFTLLGFTGLVYAYLKSIKVQRLIEEQKCIIEASLVEKDSLLKEIHHRVKNNLQTVSGLLNLQSKNTQSKDAIKALEEGMSRVKAMALIHQKLYQNDDLSVIEMQNYIESLVNSVQSVFKKGEHDINITIEAQDVELDIDRAIPFGLILNELVSNSFKYAFPEECKDGQIYIHLRKSEEQGFFEYTDNGVGMTYNTDKKVNSSMGIRLISRLVNQLQSTMNIDKTTEGVRFWFNFK